MPRIWKGPPQHGVARCVECGTLLSTYNPYRYCGPCRMRIAASHGKPSNLPWEKQPKREAVRVGPILEEGDGSA